MKTWIQAALIFIGLCVLMALMNDYDDRKLAEQVKREAIAQQIKEREAMNNKTRKLAVIAEYMTGFSMIVR